MGIVTHAYNTSTQDIAKENRESGLTLSYPASLKLASDKY